MSRGAPGLSTPEPHLEVDGPGDAHAAAQVVQRVAVVAAVVHQLCIVVG